MGGRWGVSSRSERTNNPLVGAVPSALGDESVKKSRFTYTRLIGPDDLRIRLSDKNSRLRPRKASGSITQADEAELVLQPRVGEP